LSSYENNKPLPGEKQEKIDLHEKNMVTERDFWSLPTIYYVEFKTTGYEVALDLGIEWETRAGYTPLFFVTLTTTKADLCWITGPGQVRKSKLYHDPEAVLIELLPMVRAHFQRIGERLRLHLVLDATVGENLIGGQIHIHLLVSANNIDLEKSVPDNIMKRMIQRKEVSRNLVGWADAKTIEEKLLLLAKQKTRKGWKWGHHFDFQKYMVGGGAAEYVFQPRHKRLLVSEVICCRKGARSCKRGKCANKSGEVRTTRAVSPRLVSV